jgi:hypothetical protein
MNELIIENLEEQIETLNQIILTKDEIIANAEQQNDAYKTYIVGLENIIIGYKALVYDLANRLKNQ